MNNAHDMKLSNYNKNYYKSNQSSHKEEVRQKFVLDCVNNNDILLFEKLIALEFDKIENKNNITEYKDIDLLINELILCSDYNIWGNFLENINYKYFLRNSLKTAFICNCQPFIPNSYFKKSCKYIEDIKKISFIQLLSYTQDIYINSDALLFRVNQPDFSFPFDLNFDINIDIKTIIKLEKEKFGKGYSILYLMPNWKKEIDSYFDIFFIDHDWNDLIDFHEYIKNNGEKNLLALKIGKF